MINMVMNLIENIKEQNVWNTLKNDSKPVILYGMGLGAEKIMDTLAVYGVKIEGIFASDAFVRGHSFRGYKVHKYSEICEIYEDFNVVLCFASSLDNVIDNIKRINSEHTVFAPDVPVAGGGLFSREFIEENDAAFDTVYKRLADEESKKVYLDILNFKAPLPIRIKSTQIFCTLQTVKTSLTSAPMTAILSESFARRQIINTLTSPPLSLMKRTSESC